MGEEQKEHVSERFARLLTLYRKPDGGEWGGQDLENATGGTVTRSYVANLKKGRIENPGLAKLEAIATVMGFPPALWFGGESSAGGDRIVDGAPVAALDDGTVMATMEETLSLGSNDRRLLLRLSRQISPPPEGG